MKRLILALGVALSTGCGGGLLPAALASPIPSAPELSTVRIGAATPENFIQLPLAVADQLGYFKAQGVSVKLDGTLGMTALANGDVDAVSLPYEWTLRAHLTGTDLVMVALYQVRPGFILSVGQPHFDQVKTMKDLVGKPVGVPVLASPTETFARWLALREGVDPDSIVYKAVGVATAMSSALASGSIWAATQVDPPASRMEKNGTGRVLYETRTAEGARKIYGGTGAFASQGLMIPRAFIQRYPRTTHAVVAALVMALRYIHTHSPAQIADVVPSLYAQADKDNYISSLQNNIGAYSPDGLVPPAAAQAVFDVVKQVVPAVAAGPVDLSRTYDNTFARAANP